MRVSRRSIPSAVRVRSAIAVAVESNLRANIVKVVRWPRRGRTRVKRFRGYEQPTLSRVGRGASLVMIRRRDGAVVSRRWVPRRGWSTRDKREISARFGGGYRWPNAPRSSPRRLRFIVQGPRCPNNVNSNAVLAYTRRL